MYGVSDGLVHTASGQLWPVRTPAGWLVGWGVALEQGLPWETSAAAEVGAAPKSHCTWQFELYVQLLLTADGEASQERCKQRCRESSGWGAEVSREELLGRRELSFFRSHVTCKTAFCLGRFSG